MVRISRASSLLFVLALAPILTLADEPNEAAQGLRGPLTGEGSVAAAAMSAAADESVAVAGASYSAETYAGATQLPELSNASASQSEASCSDVDMALINAKGGGHTHGTFPELVGRCGKQGYSVWSGFHSGWMTKCIRKEVPISESCASCYVIIGRYAAKNCKWACLWGSWCRTSCLTCNEYVRDSVNKCVGHESPEAEHC
eukprot:TRINITY_DN40153_c0_g1_i1.p1 TRINITY_DN40153_c0_g1~~TRINITY_DN40153_c0_g1_i1.p1  ORF type:complete len:201 (-),score=18.37 TRINITY_DN40153_c0_g1_i1:88-690(-)